MGPKQRQQAGPDEGEKATRTGAETSPPVGLTLEALQAALAPLEKRLQELENPPKPVSDSPGGETGGVVAVDLTTGPVGTGEAAAPQDVDVDDAMPGGGPPALAEDPDLVRGFCEYTEGNPYERPVHEAAELEPHTWELSETTGCTDYRIAVEKQDKSHHEIKVLHACLSYFYDALAEWSGRGEVSSADAVGRAAMERVGNTLHGVFDLLERRRAELEVLLRARSALATEEDRAAADHIKNLGRGFAGGANIRHPGLAKELATFMKEAANARLKALAKATRKRDTDPKPGKETDPKTGKEGTGKGTQGGRGGRQNE